MENFRIVITVAGADPLGGEFRHTKIFDDMQKAQAYYFDKKGKAMSIGFWLTLMDIPKPEDL